MMDQGREYILLVQQAQLGDRGSLDNLAELVRGRLYAYIYRIVLRDDIVQDHRPRLCAKKGGGYNGWHIGTRADL